MAHEGLVAFLIILGVLLLLGYYLGPRCEVRVVKRTEGKIMLVPSAVILFVLAVIVFSGILG
ncbi:hypothetical protein EU524_01745 [Candidatus Thorarchaeota archaeon]|jgi:membrane protein DedA with SNARE-associated domain|nr:MAG: hypothetical protein EU524_01745 [Candidatus Thorarchaeota archaeon]